MRRGLAAPLLAALVCGCGSAPRESGRATLWITRNRGAHVLLVKKIPAGLTAMEALRREAKVETRYGGRFVQAIDGVAGDLGKRRDWFYFVNGYEADRSAADYTLRRGDVEWWDYRSWSKQMHVPVVVGAFPEPFLHGYDGTRRPAIVATSNAKVGRAVARRLRARLMLTTDRLPGNANVLVLGRSGPARFEAGLRAGASAGSPVRMLFVGDWHELFDGTFSRRYEVKP